MHEKNVNEKSEKCLCGGVALPRDGVERLLTVLTLLLTAPASGCI